MSNSNLINYEWESTISIKSNENEYLQALNDTNNKTDVIFLLNDGIRLSNRSIQKKITTYRRRLLTYYHNEWTPIERTIATEEYTSLPQTYTIEKCIHRVIITIPLNDIEIQTNNQQQQQQQQLINLPTIRISYNKEICQFGEKYNIEYEIEYPMNSDYKDILRYERQLIKVFLQRQHKIQRDIMTRINMFSCVMSKVQMWNCFDPNQPYIWAYKWNGIKSKILITHKKYKDSLKKPSKPTNITTLNTSTTLSKLNNYNNSADDEDDGYITYVWSDDSTITNCICRGKNIQHLINICCAVEILDDRIMIIEAIGTMIDNEIYTTEPMTNASFLKSLNNILKDDVRIDNKPVYVQRFYPPPLPNCYNKDCDGFIIIQNDLIIKWKIPTIDVKCITEYTFRVGSTTIPLNFIGEPGKIYEITYKNEVLRQRTDRLAASSDQEYAIFLESAKMLKQLEDNQNTD